MGAKEVRMTDPPGNERISVSRDQLRAELAYLKLDLIQSLASKTEVDRLDARVAVLELHGSPALVTTLGKFDVMTAKLESLESWRNKLLGAFAFALLVEPI